MSENPEERDERADQGGVPEPSDDSRSPEGAPAAGEPAAEGASPSSMGDIDEGGPARLSGEQEQDMSAFEDDVEDSELSKALAQVGQLDDDLAHARADLYNLNQEYGNYVRRSKESASAHRAAGQEEVVAALIGVLDDIDAARAHGDLADGPFAAIAQKLEDTLGMRFGLERYGAEGDAFDPALHEALMAQTSAEVDHPVVKQVLQPGYRLGSKVLRATKVLVENPE